MDPGWIGSRPGEAGAALISREALRRGKLNNSAEGERELREERAARWSGTLPFSSREAACFSWTSAPSCLLFTVREASAEASALTPSVV